MATSKTRKKRRASKKPGAPSELTIWTYQVGFGDCFLLRFLYPGDERRHVLIDFGTTAKPKGVGSRHMVRVAEDIRKQCGGRLDAVVVTHRHKDHLSGFATRGSGKGSGDIIASLRPRIVVQPWTEHPRAQPGARRAPRITRSMRLHAATLARMQDIAGAALGRTRKMRRAIDFGVAQEIEFLGDDNLKNASAVRNLANMGRGRRGRYVSFGSSSGLESVLPGVEVHVLGPPTLEQAAEIAHQRSRDPEEFWHFWGIQALASRSTRTGESRLFPRAPVEADPQWARWFRHRVTNVLADSTLQLVRILDEAMNNTSVILLFEVRGKRLLFPGDAQIESWLYALGRADVRRLLRGVHVYKVGHHGSLNATPKKSLWPLFRRRSTDRHDPDRLISILSTLPGKHGSRKRRTEVPRRKLEDALEADTTLIATTRFGKTELAREHSIPLGRRRRKKPA